MVGDSRKEVVIQTKLCGGRKKVENERTRGRRSDVRSSVLRTLRAQFASSFDRDTTVSITTGIIKVCARPGRVI